MPKQVNVRKEISRIQETQKGHGPGGIGLKWRLISLCVIVTVMTAIYFFSSQPGPDSNGLSEGIAERLLKILGIYSYDNLEILNFILRKGAHFSIYFLLGVSLNVLLSGDRRLTTVLLCIVIGGLFAVSDEIHQSYTFSRTSSAADMLLDTCGVAAGSAATSFLVRKWRK